ncbi:MAG: glutamate--tRNA ligase [Candidatus Gracilibacteria bacterium]|nr:glutamate--tRNA ligase [Candidatus Gracilibacteria bacterium]
MNVVTRFAPSPTGYLHVGGLRTCLYNYLYAKNTGGKFMLRIEDTDRSRYVEGAIENMVEMLTKLGLNIDEGPNNPGNAGPYLQSERLDIYKKYVQKLLDEDKAYYCFCSSDRLDKLRKEQEQLSLPTKYDKKCRYLSEDEIKEKLEAGEPYTIRLKVPENQIVKFKDTVKGKIEINTKDIDEQVLMKTDGFPTYHLANVVDDHLMEITHVIRGEEWVPSTPKHILLYGAFGWEAPEFVHLPLLLGMDKKKLSKRQGDVAVEKYIEKGYLVDALINYMAFLGWNPKSTEEIFSMDELIANFKLENLNKSGAVFDVEKLNWYNSKYLVAGDINDIYEKFMAWAEIYDNNFYKNTLLKADNEYNKSVLLELKTKIKKFDEFKEQTTFFYSDDIKVDTDIMLNEKMKITNMEIVKNGLNLTLNTLKNLEGEIESIDQIKTIFIEAIKEAGMKNGQVLWPVRVALTGEKFSPGALEMMYILGKDKSINRLETLMENL